MLSQIACVIITIEEIDIIIYKAQLITKKKSKLVCKISFARKPSTNKHHFYSLI